MEQKRLKVLRNAIKHNALQVLAITEKNIKLQIRFKFQLIVGLINPILTILMPLIIFNKLFNFNESFGPWTPQNYIVFLLSTYKLNLLIKTITYFPQQLRIEKFWKTLPALIIAPFNRFDLLLGIFFSSFIIISVPFILFFILALIFYPISFLTIMFVLFIYMLIALIFSGIGLLIGVFAISNENIWRFLEFSLSFIFWASCISYPFDIFPESAQYLISLNPLYYIFTILRMTWIDNNIFITINNNSISFIILLTMAIFLPLISVYIFNRIFKKYGVIGY
jgi:ABC-type polysaccharide/polyol phosphate export permease